jgi:hypothetical protein
MALLARYEMNVPAPDAARQRSKLSLRAPSFVRRGLATTILQVIKEAITALNRDITTISIDATSDDLRCMAGSGHPFLSPYTLRGCPNYSHNDADIYPFTHTSGRVVKGVSSARCKLVIASHYLSKGRSQ